METTNLIDNAVNVTVTRHDVFEQAYERLLPKLQALAPDELLSVNVDMPATVATVLGVVPGIRDLRAEVAEKLPAIDLTTFDDLEACAFALSFAHAQYLAASAPQDDLQKLAEQATDLRETLRKDAEALAQRELLDGDRLKELKGPIGYKNVATDLQVLTALFRHNWASVEGKTGVQLAELEQAADFASRTLIAVGVREKGPAFVAASADLRARAFTLFMRTYDHVRRAVGFLRWEEGDADKVAPSVYAGRGNGRRKEPAVATANEGGGDAGKEGNGGGSAAASGGAGAATSESANGDGSGNGAAGPKGNGAVKGTPVGWPGSSPFVR